MSDPLLIIIAAPSGGGKSTVLRRVFAEVPALQFSISHTTRAPRAGEQNGREYFFVDEDTFRASIAEGAFARAHTAQTPPPPRLKSHCPPSSAPVM